LNPVPRPVRVEVIGCNEKWALTGAGNERDGFFLKRTKAIEGYTGIMYKIFSKFRIREKNPKVSQVDSSSTHDQTFDGDEEARHRHPDSFTDC